MAVYVDNMRIRYGRMKMSHLIADTSEELRSMAQGLGLERYIQHAGEPKEHLDVSMSKRAEAIAAGAIAHTARDGVEDHPTEATKGLDGTHDHR